jgi:drug/metabolite transporter (DMT)-like permease
LAGAILAGGVAAPALQLIGLRNTAASTASLLLNFESVTTALIAALIFKESVGKRGIWSIGAVTLGCILLSWNGGAWGFSPGALGIIGACLLWGVDNNLSRQISGKDPVLIVGIKGSSAGLFSLGLALLIGNPLPAIRVLLPALLLGALSYGFSLQLFMSALRGLGAVRTSALFGTAPFIGTAISFLIFHETPSRLTLIALPLMILGAWLIFTEDHRHEHLHLAVEHDHLHNHPDLHHDHNHPAGEMISGPAHGHNHQHQTLRHSHQHLPDIDHRHTHPAEKG